MNNKQVPKADSKFQKIARKNHRKWKIRLLGGGNQKASSGGSPYAKKPDYDRALSAPPGFGGSLEESQELNEIIVKRGDKYCLVSKSKTKEGKRKNLGCYPTRGGAVKREKQVQYFKHIKEQTIIALNEILSKKESSQELLKEFTQRDRQAILNDGENFTISYEIEMQSRDRINGEGYYSNNKNGTDIANLNGEEQVEFFGLEETLSESARDSDADQLYTEVVDNNSDASDVLACIISAYMERKEVDTFPCILNDKDVETFVIGSFFTGDRGSKYHDMLINLPRQDSEFIEKIKQAATAAGYDFENENTDRELDYSGDVNSQHELLGYFMGFIGNDWDIDFYITKKNVGYSPKIFLENLISDLPEDYYETEFAILEMASENVFRVGRYPTLGSFESNRLYRINDEEAIKRVKGFSEFYDGVRGLTAKAEELIESSYESYVENFDYDDWGIDLSAYEGAYDSDRGDYPEDNYDGGNALEDYLPKFWSEYGHRTVAESDGSLNADHNTEIKMDTYLDGIEEAMKYIDLFFDDFEDQSNFYFDDNTGLHTNVGMITGSSKNYNFLKALLLIGEEIRDYPEPEEDKSIEDEEERNKVFQKQKMSQKARNIPFVYTATPAHDLEKEDESTIESMQKRSISHWSQPMKKRMFQFLKKEVDGNRAYKEELLKLYQDNNFDQISKILSERVKSNSYHFGSKSYGFNMGFADPNSRGSRIEFRYPGKKITRDILKNVTIYYCHIIKAALDPEYKKEEYHSKLIGFLQELFTETPGKVKEIISEKHKVIKWLKQIQAEDKISFDYYKNELIYSLTNQIYYRHDFTDDGGEFNNYSAIKLKIANENLIEKLLNNPELIQQIIQSSATLSNKYKFSFDYIAKNVADPLLLVKYFLSYASMIQSRSNGLETDTMSRFRQNIYSIIKPYIRNLYLEMDKQIKQEQEEISKANVQTQMNDLSGYTQLPTVKTSTQLEGLIREELKSLLGANKFRSKKSMIIKIGK